MNQVRIGIIGIGNMGSGHAQNIVEGKVPGLCLTAVADREEGRRKWASENLPEGLSIFSEGEELIESDVCDAILIATPHYQHPELTISGLKHGLHVLCEKPAGVYTKQVRMMNEAAEKSDRVFAIMLNQRTNCIYRKMHELIQSGELGAIKRVNWIITDWYRTQAYYDSGSWRATWDGEGGGVLLNQCPHNLDLLQWLCGMPSKVRAFCGMGKWHDIEVEDDVTAYLEYPNGATGVFVTTTADAPGTNRLEVTLEMGKMVCENGKLLLYRLSENERVFCKTAAGGFDTPRCQVEEVETDGENEQHIGVMKAFANRILNGTPLLAEGIEGIRGLTLSNAMYLSDWLDKTVEIPFDEDLFLVELNKRRAMHKGVTITGFADEIDNQLDRQMEVIKKLGISHIEMRGVDGKGLVEYGIDEVKKFKMRLDANGIALSSLGSPLGKIFINEDFAPHMELFKHTVEIAHIMNTPYIRMFSFFIPHGEKPEQYSGKVMEQLGQFVDYAKANQVILLHENEKEIYGDVASRCLEIMKNFYGEHFKAVFDFANFVQCHQDTLEAYELLKPYIAYIHIKDAIWADGSVVPAGMGDGHVKDILGMLKDTGYHGYLSLEPHLTEFQGFLSLEHGKKQEKRKLTGEEAYTMAYDALKKILGEL